MKSPNVLKLTLFCAYEQYDKEGREDRITNVRQKLRELGRLLLVLNKLNSHCKSFFDYLCPEHFDDVLDAVKKNFVTQMGRRGGDVKSMNFLL